MPQDKALHFSEGKPGVEQIPPEVLMEWGAVYSYGEKKYARDNWIYGTEWNQFAGSALRHFLKWLAGEDFDNCDGSEGCTPEADFCRIHSRQSHLAQAIWNTGVLRYFQIYGIGVDNRIGTVRAAAHTKAYQGEAWVEIDPNGEGGHRYFWTESTMNTPVDPNSIRHDKENCPACKEAA